MSERMRGLLLFAHGARDPNWARPFEAVLQVVRERAPETHSVLSFLEFMTPGIAEAGRQLAQDGCEQVEIVPLFLGAGGHVRKDLPLLVDELRAEHPNIVWTVRPAVGEAPGVVLALAEASLARHQGVEWVAPTSPIAP
jgi:sirohydrochlorin cobaltochelatase